MGGGGIDSKIEEVEKGQPGFRFLETALRLMLSCLLVLSLNTSLDALTETETPIPFTKM